MYGDREYQLSGDVLAARKGDVDRVKNTLFRVPPCGEFELKSVVIVAMEVDDGIYQ